MVGVMCCRTVEVKKTSEIMIYKAFVIVKEMQCDRTHDADQQGRDMGEIKEMHECGEV